MVGKMPKNIYNITVNIKNKKNDYKEIKYMIISYYDYASKF
jgi:hypothetical protein